jgi:hypothetical protein
MSAQLILRIVGSITAGLVLIVGIIILTGSLIPSSVPENYRVVLGIVMVVYGTYRIVMIWMKQRQERNKDA